jgi:hypothetical protein
MYIGKGVNELATSIYFDGGLDDVRIYENSLSHTDINTIYSQYFEQINASGNLLIQSGLVLNVDLVDNGSNIGFDVGVLDSTTVAKSICIADHNLNSRQIIDQIINGDDSKFTSAIKDVVSGTNNISEYVVTIKQSDPGLEFEVKSVTSVNNFDVFVYASDGTNETISRSNVNADSNVGPYGVLLSSSYTVSGEIGAYTISGSVFNAYSKISKYYVYASYSQYETPESVKTNGVSEFVNVIRNKVQSFTTTYNSSQNYSYVHLLVEDEEGNLSNVSTLSN